MSSGCDAAAKKQLRTLAEGTLSNDTRRFNLREGLIHEDDFLPSRFHKEALPETNQIITEGTMKQLLKDYYKARGWDNNGLPAEEE
jgi:aldehyde:ferredoxin oxidoreductase